MRYTMDTNFRLFSMFICIVLYIQLCYTEQIFVVDHAVMALSWPIFDVGRVLEGRMKQNIRKT